MDGRSEKLITLTDEQIIQVEALAPYLTVPQIADYLGCGKTRFYQLLKEYPELDERYKKGKAKVLAKVAQMCVRMAIDEDNPNPAMICFYLKTQGGWREKTEDEEKENLAILKEAITIVRASKADADTAD